MARRKRPAVGSICRVSRLARITRPGTQSPPEPRLQNREHVDPIDHRVDRPGGASHIQGVCLGAREQHVRHLAGLDAPTRAEFWKFAGEYLASHRPLVEGLMIKDWAGPAAHRKYARRPVNDGYFQDDEEDLRRRALYLCLGDEAKAGELAEEMKQRAIAFINRPEIWVEVQKLAAPLAERQELSEAEVEQILGRPKAGRRRAAGTPPG
jgi:hypothetical protein